ncbi:MAG: HPr(Ser) kinase/phosphatase [Thermodesulfobacteriota bacterium]
MRMKIRELLDRGSMDDMGLRLSSGEMGLDKELTELRIQKPGLLLTGLLEGLHPDRVQIFGAAEVEYLLSLGEAKLKRSITVLENANIAAIVVTRGQDVPKFLIDFSERNEIPLFSTRLTSSLLIERLSEYLEDRLAPETTIHGVLVDVLGVGILITGKSGIGKSECALDLISRGNRLVADDAVIVRLKHPATLFGLASDIISYHMEIRGLGIINIKDIYGITSIRTKKQMDLLVELVDWDPEGVYERLGFDERTFEILGVKLPHLKIPVSPGRSVATIVEVAARNRILKIMGYDPSKKFEHHLDSIIRSNTVVKS